MTNEELKEALLNKRPVVVTTNDGTEMHCKYVFGINYRAQKGKIVVYAEVLDTNGRCHYHCEPKQIRYEV